MSHSIVEYRAMGKLVAEGKKLPVEDLYHAYERLSPESAQAEMHGEKAHQCAATHDGLLQKAALP
jgi:uncharacterized protein YbgA (DUF1722 family)